MKKIVILFSFFYCFTAHTQSVDGYWYGTANTSKGISANNYLVEMIIKQSGSSVQGIVSYYFKNTFRSFKVAGTYSAASRKLSFFNIPLTYYGSNDKMEVDCPMDLFAQLRVAKAGSNLSGEFKSKKGYKLTCPDIFFDFGLNKDATNQDSILTALRQFKEKYQLWTPSATDTVVTATVLQRPIINYVVTAQYKERQKEVTQEIIVESDSLKIDFYDNGEVDGDSISIFFNDKILASSQKLSTKAINLTLGLDGSKVVNELSMFADNLGSIPPNTALMLIYDGKKRYEVRLSSTLKTNGTVRIKRKTSPRPSP